jgi:hypothetical protein
MCTEVEMSRARNEALYTEWEERVSRWKASGLSSEKFAAREGISRARALVSWSHRLRKVQRAPASLPKHEAVRVVQIPAELIRSNSQQRATLPIEVVLRSGVRVLVPADEATLCAVLRVVEQAT